jgi:integrase/recombinase XerD
MTDIRNTSVTTIAIKLRAFRAIFNEAIADGVIHRDHYPFGRRKYIIQEAETVKKALPINVIKKIYEFNSDQYEDNVAKSYWLFVYFGNGMNPKDMALLKFKNIEGDYIRFRRAKTKNTTGSSSKKTISAFLNEDMLSIIDKYGNKDKHPNNYIFPVITADMNLLTQHNQIRKLVKFILDGMVRFCQKAEITLKVNNMKARHSFATVMKRQGATTEYIQEALGHADKKTTEIYLDSFEDEVKKDFSKLLKPF